MSSLKKNLKIFRIVQTANDTSKNFYVHNLETIIFRFLILKIKKIFWFFYQKKLKKIFFVQNRYCNPISVLHAPVGVCKTGHSAPLKLLGKVCTLDGMPFIIWKQLFYPNFLLALPIGKFPNPFYIILKKKNFYFTEKKLFATMLLLH